ncbi:hypothetical protein [Clostridium senegalense]|uniref:hypothetical protein n=1 Tax=Clostridium senegalense TaxID=1465809 RepID=UPI000287DE68|nr:hypothetical protein [Clostridium senegalense]
MSIQYKDFNTKRKVDKLISKEQNEIMREYEIKNLIKEGVKAGQNCDFSNTIQNLKEKIRITKDHTKK